MRPRVLILTCEEDEHATQVAGLLRQEGTQVVCFDLADLPSHATMAYRGGGGEPARRVLTGREGEVELSEVTAIWYRRPGLIGSRNTRTPRFCRVETAEIVTGLFGSLSGEVRWLPGTPAQQRVADCKIDQLVRAEALGLQIPRTCITNDRQEFLRFYEQCDGNVVSKMASSAVFGEDYPDLARYTEPVTRDDLLHVERLRNAPVIFQEYVPKRVELRVTVVGSEVFAAEIHSQRSRHARLDWRRYDLGNTPHTVHELPSAVREACLRMVHGFGLTYGALDFIVRPDGQYVFLELNPNGQYMWIEALTGLPIAGAVCRFLRGDAGRTEETLAVAASA